MIRYFWKYRFFNLAIIIIGFIACLITFDSVKVFFDSERIIELVNVDKDIIDKSIDDKNLLVVGIELKDSLSLPLVLELDSILDQLDTNRYIRSINSVFNEKFVINQLIPIPIRLLKFGNQNIFSTSLERIKTYESRFITSDFKFLF